MTSNLSRASVLAAVLRAIVEGDRAVLERHLTPDVRVWSPEFGAATRAELIDTLTRRDEAFEGIELDVVPLDVSGPYACAEWSLHMTQVGPLELANGLVVGPTNGPIDVHGASVAEFDHEQICAIRQYWDAASLVAQLGAVEQNG